MPNVAIDFSDLEAEARKHQDVRHPGSLAQKLLKTVRSLPDPNQAEIINLLKFFR